MRVRNIFQISIRERVKTKIGVNLYSYDKTTVKPEKTGISKLAKNHIFNPKI